MLTAQPLAGIVDDIEVVIKKGERYLSLIAEVLEDPALPTVAAQVQTLRRITKSSGKTVTTSSGAKVPAPQPKGVGLSKAVAPLNWYIWTREHKAATWAILAGAVLIPVGLGVAAGRLSKRCGARQR